MGFTTISIENTTTFQYDLISKAVHLSKKTFHKETFQLLHKNLNFVPAPKVYNNHRLSEEMQKFYGTIKLKGYFIDLNRNTVLKEEPILKPANHKNGLPTKIIIPY